MVGVVGHAPELRSRARSREGGGPGGEAAAPSAPDVVALLRYLRAELGRAGLSAASSVYASEVRPEIWAVAEERTESAETHLVAHISDDDTTRLEMSVRRTGAGDVAVAVEDRGVNVFLGPDESSLATQVGEHLARRAVPALRRGGGDPRR